MPEQSWQEFVEEFHKVTNDPDYKPFRPILSWIESLIGRHLDEDELSARMLLKFVYVLHSEHAAGNDVLPLLDQESVNSFVSDQQSDENQQPNQGIVQSGFDVQGDFKQANRDFIDKSIKNFNLIVEKSTDELKTTTQGPKTLVPIVPVVMTATQARELITKEIFKHEPNILEQGFVELYDFLQAEAADWINRYGDRPQDWKPFGSGPHDVTLEQLIGNALNEIEEWFPDLDGPLAARFNDVATLTEGRRSNLIGIRERGCIVILDVISFRHPKLQRAFQQTLLDAYPLTSTVSIAPNEGSYKLATKLAVSVQLKVEEMEFQRRMADLVDNDASRKMLEEQPFAGWFSGRLQNLGLIPKRGAPRVA